MSKMKQIPLGNTGLMVSEFGFGGIPLTRVPEDEAVAIIRRALELGVRFFDTARLYGDSEAKMGRALQGRRDRVVLASKTRARDAETAARHLEQSLRNLRTDWIDLYQLHNLSEPDALESILAPDGAWPVVQRAREQGVIKAVGFSSHNPAPGPA